MNKKDIKIIYIEIDEELTSLIDRIKKARESEIVIVIPKRAVILQSVVNLKLLKNQAEKLAKSLSLVTTDKTGRNLASQVGLTVYQSLDKNIKPEIVDKEEVDDSKYEEFKEAIHENRREIREPSRAVKKRFWESYSKRNNKEYGSKEKINYTANVKSYTVISPNKKILTTLFSISILLLVVIGYYVLPNATILVQPKIEKISYTTNIVLADSSRYENVLKDASNLKMIGSYPIEITELSHTKQFQATGERFTGQSASGTIKIINTVYQPWKLVKTTRFQADNGVVFRLQETVNIGSNETKEVFVIADEKDVNGEFVGDKGNLIAGVKLIIPGLREESQKKIYAEVVTDITNGVTKTTAVLTKEDVLAGKANIIDELFKLAETKLIERIADENKNNGTNLRLFTSRDIESISKEVIAVYTPDDLVDKDVSTFEITAKVRVKGVAYNQDQILEIMKIGLEIKVLEDRLLVDIKGDDVEFHVVSKDDAEKKLKVESTIFGITEYKVNSRLGDKIRGKILDKSLDESERIIKEMPEIGEVRIETWPFWVRRIPGVRSNIKVERLN